jgi:hypothetical protein
VVSARERPPLLYALERGGEKEDRELRERAERGSGERERREGAERGTGE